MTTLTFIAIGLAALVGALAAYSFTVGTRRMLRDDGDLRLAQVLRARKLPMPSPAGRAEVMAAALAARRCVACGEHRRCDVRIAERDWTGIARICPNRGFIESRARAR